MDQYLKDLLANRPNVAILIVEDSARIHFDASQRSLFSDQSFAEMETSSSKADTRCKCKSQSPSSDDSTKTKDLPLEKPAKRSFLRRSFPGSTKPSSRSKKLSMSSKATKLSSSPDKIPSAEERDAKKAQRIIDLVQSLAFRAAMAVHNVKRREREPATRARE